MTIDTAAVDAALTTTRAVRRRLDLERRVDDQILLDCIDIAEQAPTGGNQGSRRWLIVRDPGVKEQLAQLHLDAAGSWMIEARDQLAGSGHPQERTVRSAAHLAEHLAEVPAIVIPTIIGTHDGSGRPGLFDSVIQAAWSFCVALRARGLGTTWTTAILTKAPQLKELLGIPEGTTEIAMFPVAWTKGTDFSPARRHPARSITFFDRYSRTYESGPSRPVTLADGPGTVVEIDVDAPAERVWETVCDIDLPADYSEEFLGAASGTTRRPARRWGAVRGTERELVHGAVGGPVLTSMPSRPTGPSAGARLIPIGPERAGDSSSSHWRAPPGCATGSSSARAAPGSPRPSNASPTRRPASSEAGCAISGRTCSG